MTTPGNRNDEFSVIDEVFRPLAGLSPEARGLSDDVAVIEARPGFDLVVTSDAIVEDVHFLSNDPVDQVAQKALRVNLSDLAAKGADPYGYQLMIAWPHGTTRPVKYMFAGGLKRDQDHFGLCLFGGDTVSTSGPLSISVTMFGYVPTGQCLSRSGARPGDRVLVSGPIGEAWLGLKALLAVLPDHDPDLDADWIRAYRLPEPRLDVGGVVRRLASASMDISDGLVVDAGHLAKASQVRISLDMDTIPTSRAARSLMVKGITPLDLITGGDDYQILCTVPQTNVGAFLASGFVDIGACLPIHNESEAIVEVMTQGRRLEIERRGWVHA